MARFSIGQVAKQTGATVKTIRLYEKQALIRVPQRTASGYRRYSPDTVQRVRFIRRANELGFSLNDIGNLLELRDASERSCSKVKRQVLEKIDAIDATIHGLADIRGVLADLAKRCDLVADIGDCPILVALDQNEENGNDSG